LLLSFGALKKPISDQTFTKVMPKQNQLISIFAVQAIRSNSIVLFFRYFWLFLQRLEIFDGKNIGN
jgi:hypothetical protein